MNVGWYGVGLALAITVVVGLLGFDIVVRIGSNGAPSVEGGPSVKMAVPVSFRVDDQTHPVTAPSLGIEQAQIRDVRGTLSFRPPGGTFHVANLAIVIALLSLAMWVLGQLRAVFRTLRDGQPFVPANTARIRWIGWAVIIGELVRAAVVLFENYYVMTHFQAEGLSFYAHTDLNIFAIIDGLIILVIAEVFRAGTRLDEEQSLTV
jgi:amino acid transporter